MRTYTHPTRPGIWKKIDEWEGREGRCIECNVRVLITHAIFKNQDSKQEISDRSRLCLCNAGYDYDFVEVKHATSTI